MRYHGLSAGTSLPLGVQMSRSGLTGYWSEEQDVKQEDVLGILAALGFAPWGKPHFETLDHDISEIRFKVERSAHTGAPTESMESYWPEKQRHSFTSPGRKGQEKLTMDRRGKKEAQLSGLSSSEAAKRRSRNLNSREAFDFPDASAVQAARTQLVRFRTWRSLLPFNSGRHGISLAGAKVAEPMKWA